MTVAGRDSRKEEMGKQRTSCMTLLFLLLKKAKLENFRIHLQNLFSVLSVFSPYCRPRENLELRIASLSFFVLAPKIYK